LPVHKCIIVNSSKAVVLKLDDVSVLSENAEKIKEVNHYEIYKFDRPDLVNNYFSGVLPAVTVNYYTLVDGQVLMTRTEAYLEKVINDIENHATLSNSETFKNLLAEIPEDYHLILFKNKLKIAGQSYMKAQTFKVDNEFLFTNLVLKSFTKTANEGLIEQVLSYDLKELPKISTVKLFNFVLDK